MRVSATRLLLTALLATAIPCLVGATDVDGPGDCSRFVRDFGDAPEDFPAYTTGMIGHFPTCVAATAPGSQSSLCAAPISTPPGATGFVRHEQPTGGYWLGCGVSPTDDGVDTEPDGKTSGGALVSFCAQISTDCLEPAFGGAMTFGQDECYGDSDAGLAAPALEFVTCSSSTVTFSTFNCGPPRTVYLNILVDWNHDGDWNDNDKCSTPTSGCWYEWAVKNVTIVLPTGCTSITSPAFLTGDTPGGAWLRITISDTPVPDDFPWNGSAGIPGQIIQGGETEDYPVTVRRFHAFVPCDDAYLDFGDAPEDILAYPGGPIGHFPTCTFPGSPGTQEVSCVPALSTPPGPTGVVIHEGAAGEALRYWLGCGATGGPPGGLDPEGNGKVNLSAVVGDPSACDPGALTDCVETAFGGAMTFGQDECYGDDDAGVTAAAIDFTACTMGSVPFETYNCGPDVDVFLNILVDWNEDGDWNDNFTCVGACAYEWAVKNVPIVLAAGCQAHVSPSFLAGPNPGNGWLRITITAEPVPDDFTWNGSLGTASGRFRSGETEDYAVTIQPPLDPCAIEYRDFGDAPEELIAYPSGVVGRFPTCVFPSLPGTLDISCAGPLGTPPGPTGYVMHVASATDAFHVWLGCGTPPPLGGIDSEFDGKVNAAAAIGAPSFCEPAIPTDCVELAFGGMPFGQDECYGDVVDAGVAGPLSFAACSLGAVPMRVANCSATNVDAFLNVLVDWSHDGDWNDNGDCVPAGTCVHEWALKNVPIPLAPGCNGLLSPSFPVGLRLGPSWMRVTVTLDPVPDDFPWNGSAGTPAGFFRGGETEDYPVEVITSTIVGVNDRAVPGELRLAIQPNPSWDGTTVRFVLPREGPVRLAVYDLAGRKLRELAGGAMPAGVHTVEWNYRTDDGGTAPVGLYMVRLEALGETTTRTAIRVR